MTGRQPHDLVFGQYGLSSLHQHLMTEAPLLRGGGLPHPRTIANIKRIHKRQKRCRTAREHGQSRGSHPRPGRLARATVRRRPAGGCGPAPASGIQPSGMHPQPGPGCARVRRRRPAPSLRVPRSRAGSYRWPVREPRRTGGRCPATAAPGHAPVPGGRAPLRGAASYEAEG